MKKIIETYKKMSLRTKSGILVIFIGIVVTTLIIIEAVTSPVPQPRLPSEFLFQAIEEGGATDELHEGDILLENKTIEYRGLNFTIPANWHVEETEDGLMISILHEGQGHILLIEPMTSSIDLPLENNLALVSAIFRDTIPDFELDPILISGLPALRHHYTVEVGEIDYNIVGFLFSNGDELVYIQFGTPTGEVTDGELLRFITSMIFRLELPPSQFPPRE